ncbi:PTS sugar transporter subunit IIA [Oceanobacillus sp. Castelsardo]|uniref:PTS sugar transporter subunit IIA n=1 Tax=Oceanobacillus sp. Castelsardo TaxID=1851204 RepID=UPI0008399906|nr:PTS sugar transporter subunit IIA [Oceanobacillus sp. Castelsardo]
MISENHIIKDLECKDSQDAIEKLGTLLYNSGVVKETYVSAVKEREKIYPTGLPADAFDIAIPHTDSIHVNSSAIAVGVLKKPVEFTQMGSNDIVLHPQVIFMLAINDPHEQINILKRLMSLFQNKELLESVKNAEGTKEIYEILNKNILGNGDGND